MNWKDESDKLVVPPGIKHGTVFEAPEEVVQPTARPEVKRTHMIHELGVTRRPSRTPRQLSTLDRDRTPAVAFSVGVEPSALATLQPVQSPLRVPDTTRWRWIVSQHVSGLESSGHRPVKPGPAADGVPDPGGDGGRALEQDRGDMWDSGKVASDQRRPHALRRPPSKPHTTYYWKVRLWDRDGQASDWSDTAEFTSGLPDPKTGPRTGSHRVLWHRSNHQPTEVRSLPIFRREFALTQPVRSCEPSTSYRGAR